MADVATVKEVVELLVGHAKKLTAIVEEEQRKKPATMIATALLECTLMRAEFMHDAAQVVAEHYGLPKPKRTRKGRTGG